LAFMDRPRRIARERVPTIAVARDLHGFPYVDAHGQPAGGDFCGLAENLHFAPTCD
jgi:hypothetical protein